ncbi:MAG: hypothetical protein GX039_06505 [Clostridia bacterium]|nr:hypothetical protein [Clostridia bacterium]
MLPVVELEPDKTMFAERENAAIRLSRTYGNGVYCEQTECIYCLNSHYCCHIPKPRNIDGYCKDFISIND